MLNDLLPVHNVQYNPLATPPPDDNAHPSIPVGSPNGDNSTAPVRPRLSLSFLDDLRLLNPQQPSHPNPSSNPGANLAYDPQQQISGIPPNSSPSAAAPFRYGRAYDSSSSAPPGGGNSSVYEHSASASAFSAPTANATSATSVTGYPSSPPPSRHRSDNGRDQEFHSGTNRYTSQSPVESPVTQHATGIPDSHNLAYTSANSQSQSHPQAHESYSAQQMSTGLSQRATNQYSHSQTPLSSHTHSQSDRFPSVSSMLSTDRYPSRIDTKYTFPAPLPERRMSEPSSHPYGSSRQYPQAVQLNSTYSAPQPSYSLHRVNRSDSYPDLASGSGMTGGTDWQDDEREKHALNRDGRPSTGNIDPYSPIASTFSSSTSSLATGSLPSPHTAQGAHGYGSVAAGGYSLYPSPEDMYNDGRPTSSSGDSSSPSYPYNPLPNSQSVVAQTVYSDQSSKTYSFVSLPGNTVRKRPRRRYDEIERLYACSFPGCTKAYGTLNHLNAHVNMQKHGAKRHPNEFKEMRKQWRKMKKEQEAEREARRQSEVMAGGHMQDLMRRRRATEPNLYGLSSVGNEGMNNGMVSSQGNISSVNAVHDQIDLQGIDTSPYGISMGVGIEPMNNSMGSANSNMGLNGGYGHHHYAQTAAYHSHGQQRAPVGVSPLSPVSPTSPSTPYGRVSSSGGIIAPLSSAGVAAASGAYYDNIPHSQQGHEAQSHGHAQAAQRQGGSSPPPINRLPPDSTLLTPLHSQPSHMNLNSQGYQTAGLPSLSSIARMEHHTHNPQ